MKKENQHIDYEALIARYLSGECTDEESALLEKWVKERDENRRLFVEMKKVWILSSLRDNAAVDVEGQWDLMQRKMRPAVSLHRKERRRRRHFPYRWTIAAAVALLFGLVFYFTQVKRDIPLRTVIAQNETRHFTLPDGSRVDLDAGSVLRFPERFVRVRNIELQGTAFFDVRHDSLHPFVIHAGKTRIRVLGTAFSVKTGTQMTEVVVQRGKVALSAPHNEKVILLAGEKGTWKNNSLSKTQNRDANFLAWKTKEIIFDNASLNYVISKLNEVYHTHIRLAKPEVMRDCALSAHFKNEKLDEVLDVISAGLNVQFVQQGDTIFVKGKGCDSP